MNLFINWDHRLLGYLNAAAGKSNIVDAIVVFLGHYLVYFLAATLIAWWFVNSEKIKTRQAVTMAFFSFVIARFGVTEIIRALLPRQRPYWGHEVVQLIPKGAENSFPSGHATALFAIAMAVYFYNKKLGNWLFFIAVVVSIARVIAGVHFPSDVLAGAIVGLITAWIMERCLALKISKISAWLSSVSDKFLPFTSR